MKVNSIVMLSYGSLAKQFCDALVNHDYPLVQLYNRSEVQLPEQLSKLDFTQDLEHLAYADVYFLACSDKAISELAQHIPNKDALIVHFSGATDKEVLGNVKRRAVCWPMHSFQQEVNWNEVNTVIDADLEQDRNFLSQLFKQLGAQVFTADKEQKAKMHLMATLVNNFSNHLLYQAEAYCQRNEIPFEFFQTLALNTAKTAFEKGAKSSQTGPARRKDFISLEKHINLIDNEDLLKLYEYFSESIMKTYGKDL